MINRNPFCEALYHELTEVLEQIRTEETDVIKRTEKSIVAASEIMDKLRVFTTATEFCNNGEEIHFFKFWKPRFFSHLIYFLKVLNIESRKPFGNKNDIESYYVKQQSTINYFIENNLSFYQYYRMNATHLDEQYFLRSQRNILVDTDYVYFNSDPHFSSLMDYKMAKVLANEMLTNYLERCISSLRFVPNEKDSNSMPPVSKLTWTGSKASLIELVYALQSDGVFNNSNADIRQIADCFERVFNIELGNYYRVFQDIRIRKKNRTTFLDHLKRGLEKRMDQSDECPKAS